MVNPARYDEAFVEKESYIIEGGQDDTQNDCNSLLSSFLAANTLSAQCIWDPNCITYSEQIVIVPYKNSCSSSPNLIDAELLNLLLIFENAQFCTLVLCFTTNNDSYSRFLNTLKQAKQIIVVSGHYMWPWQPHVFFSSKWDSTQPPLFSQELGQYKLTLEACDICHELETGKAATEMASLHAKRWKSMRVDWLSCQPDAVYIVLQLTPVTSATFQSV